MKKVNLITVIIVAALLIIPAVVLAVQENPVIDISTSGQLSLSKNDGGLTYDYGNGKQNYTGIITIDSASLISHSSYKPHIEISSGEHAIKTEGSVSLIRDSSTLTVSKGASLTIAGGDFTFENTTAPSSTKDPDLGSVLYSLQSAIQNNGVLNVEGGSVTAINHAAQGKDVVSNPENVNANFIKNVDGGVRYSATLPSSAASSKSEMTTSYTLDALFAALKQALTLTDGVTVSLIDHDIVFDFTDKAAIATIANSLNFGEFTQGMTVLGVNMAFNYDGGSVTLTGAELIGQFTGSKYRENVRLNAEDMVLCSYEEGGKIIAIGQE